MLYKTLFYIPFIFLIIFSNGCAKRVSFDDLNKERAMELSIINTKSVELNSKDSSIIITATYLNPLNIDIVDKNKELFLIGVYVNKKDEFKKAKNNPFYKFYLNSDPDIEDFEPLEKNSKYLKLSPLSTKWSEYYLAKFPYKKTKILTLTFENSNGKKASLSFEKEL